MIKKDVQKLNVYFCTKYQYQHILFLFLIFNVIMIIEYIKDYLHRNE